LLLVEKHLIKKSDPRWEVIDHAAFLAKNLYNLANYHVRQHFFSRKRPLSLKQLYVAVKESLDYQALPRKVSQLVLISLLRSWKSYGEAKKGYEKDPLKFFGCPKIPKYKEKQKGRYLLIYNNQAISRKSLKQGWICPSGLNISVQTQQTEVREVRIVPMKTHYVVEVVYQQQETQADVDRSLIAGVDIGLNNLAAVTSNKPGFVPLLVNGRPLKSQNQFYNKRRALLQSQLSDPEHGSSQRIHRLTDRRNLRINHHLHTASRRIINHLVSQRIGTLIIGKNRSWKQKMNLGKRNNQNFVSIPHARFVSMLNYKAQLVGIKVVETSESYTSKCSFLDSEPIEKRESYMGKRIKRGLFRAKSGRMINADVNGAFNIIRKVAPNAFVDGVEGVVVHPVKVTL
jgi:putative transposase